VACRGRAGPGSGAPPRSPADCPQRRCHPGALLHPARRHPRYLFAWNDFLLSLTFITSQSRFTIPVALENIVAGSYGVLNFGQLEAGAVVSMVPCVVLFLALQRYYVRGLVARATR
jgi:hypothetical protein